MAQIITLPDDIPPYTVAWYMNFNSLMPGRNHYYISNDEYIEAEKRKEAERQKQLQCESAYQEWIEHVVPQEGKTGAVLQPIKKSAPRKGSAKKPNEQSAYGSERTRTHAGLSQIILDAVLTGAFSRFNISNPYRFSALHSFAAAMPTDTVDTSLDAILSNAANMRPLTRITYLEPQEREVPFINTQYYYHQIYNQEGIHIAFFGLDETAFLPALVEKIRLLQDIPDMEFSIKHDKGQDGQQRVTVRAIPLSALSPAEQEKARHMMDNLAAFLSAAGKPSQAPRNLSLTVSQDKRPLPATFTPFPMAFTHSDSADDSHEPVFRE